MAEHNHNICIEKSTLFAQDLALSKGKKLTPQRLQVLRILLSDHKAMGAYDILDKMRDLHIEGQGKPQPPTVYRALGFLLGLGLIHKVESQNSFYACMVDKDQDEHHLAQAFICDNCGHVEEKVAHQGAQNLFEKAAVFGFKIDKVIVECRGTCASCQAA
uniref:Uncharacterized protein n=1 Tax=OCS116 cluster bacterium TaxID=2030921 RepID=A0A2A4Z1N5_9PROT